MFIIKDISVLSCNCQVAVIKTTSITEGQNKHAQSSLWNLCGIMVFNGISLIFAEFEKTPNLICLDNLMIFSKLDIKRCSLTDN